MYVCMYVCVCLYVYICLSFPADLRLARALSLSLFSSLRPHKLFFFGRLFRIADSTESDSITMDKLVTFLKVMCVCVA